MTTNQTGETSPIVVRGKSFPRKFAWQNPGLPHARCANTDRRRCLPRNSLERHNENIIFCFVYQCHAIGSFLLWVGKYLTDTESVCLATACVRIVLNLKNIHTTDEPEPFFVVPFWWSVNASKQPSYMSTIVSSFSRMKNKQKDSIRVNK